MTLFFGLDQGFPRGLACARLRRRGRIVGVGIRKQGRWMVGGFFSCRRVLACLLETQCYLLLGVTRGLPSILLAFAQGSETAIV
jgi:hypothetical protein